MINEDKALIDRINRVLNEELLRRLLVKYFTDKKVQNFTALLYPPVLQDLPMRIPELNNKVEITPFVREMNPVTGQVKIGWNLFVLGTQRMDLGESTHNSMADLQRSVFGPTQNNVHLAAKTPQEIIEFIVKVLSASKDGTIQPSSVVPSMFSHNAVANRPKTGPTMSGSYYEKNKPF